MKLITVVALVIIAALVGPSKAEKAGGPSGKMQEEIQELHNKLIQAQLNSDIAALDRLLADDHIFTNPLVSYRQRLNVLPRFGRGVASSNCSVSPTFRCVFMTTRR